MASTTLVKQDKVIYHYVDCLSWSLA